MKLEMQHNDADAAWAAVGPVVPCLWKRGITPAALDAFVVFANRYGATQTSGWVVLSFPHPKMQLPPPEVRARIGELTSNPGPNFVSSSTVVDAEGFTASVLRSVLAGLSFIGGKGAPRHVARTPDEALAFLATQVSFDLERAKPLVHAFLLQARA